MTTADRTAPQDGSTHSDGRQRVLLVGAFRSLVPEGSDGPFGSQGGFVDTLAPAPYSLANGYLKVYAEADSNIRNRFQIELLNLSEPINIDDAREEVALTQEDLNQILSYEPDLVAFSTYCWNIDAVADAVAWLRQRRPNLRIILGGRATEGESAELLRAIPGADALVLGEGEVAFREILGRGAEDFRGIPGVVCREGMQIVSGGPASAIEDLDTIPSPFQLGVLTPPTNGVMLELSRGCLHACGYCTWNANKRLRHFGPARIEADVRWAREQGHRHITVTDSALNYNSEQLSELVEAVKRADPEGSIHFTYNIRHDCVTNAQLQCLANLPTHMVLLGIETLLPSPMAHVDRPAVDLPALKQRLHTIARAIRPPVVSIVLGLPGDTEEGFRYTLETLLSWTQADDDDVPPAGTVLVSLLQVYRGSKLWQRRQELGLVFAERGIPYLLESPSWPAASLARAKAYLVKRMGENQDALKAAEAIALIDSRGGLSPWLSSPRLQMLLADWPVGATHDGWTFNGIGLMRDTGQGVVLRLSHAQGATVRVRLERAQRGANSIYRLCASRAAKGAPSDSSLRRLDRLLQAVVARGERRIIGMLTERKRRMGAST